MLSKQAFNGLLKTLEEPPPHVKFVFATTEIRKVPVTVLSRCQRFDLRRVDAAVLIEHLASIAAQGEDRGGAGGAPADRARGGRLGARRAVDPRPGDRAWRRQGRGRDRAGHARPRRPHPHRRPLRARRCAATPPRRSPRWRRSTTTGADPAIVLTDLADFCHYVTRLKLAPNAAAQAAISETERVRGAAFAETLSLRELVARLADAAEGHRGGGRRRRARSPRPRWCWSGSAMPPTCRRRTRRSACLRGTAAAAAVAAAPLPRARRPGRRARSRRARRRRRASQPRAGAAAASPKPAPALSSFEDVIATAKAERDTAARLRARAARAAGPLRAGADRDRADAGRRAGPAAEARPGAEGLDRRALDGRRQPGRRRARRRTRRASGARPSLLDEVRADPLVQKVLRALSRRGDRQRARARAWQRRHDRRRRRSAEA